MRKIISVFLCILLWLSCVGCTPWNWIGTQDNEELRMEIQEDETLRTETMQWEEPCRKIVIKGLSFYDSALCDITIENGSSISVETTLPEALYEEYGFTVSLRDGILLLTTAEEREFSSEVFTKIRITAPFDTLEVEGEFVVSVDAAGMENFHLLSQKYAVVAVQNLNTQMTEVAASGGSEIYLSGKTAMFSGRSKEMSEIYARNLISSEADLDVSGMGEITLSVEDLLQVDISGFSDVFYYGNPSVREATSGLGTVTQKAVWTPTA